MKSSSVRLLVLIASIIVIAGFAYAELGKCPLCGMNIEGNKNTIYEIVFEEGRSAKYCCPHCGLWVHASEKDDIKKARAIDFISGEWMDPKEMYFVFNSKAVPACAPSWIAFGKESEAEMFTKGFGGEVYPFEKALEERKKHPKSMMMKM